MNDTDKLLRRHRPTPKRQLSSDFTDSVVNALVTTPQRPRSVRLHQFYVNLSRLPKLALVLLAIVAAGATTTVAYAAASWLIPKITVLTVNPVNDNNKREFLMNVKDCGVMIGGQAADNGQQRFEVAREANLSDEQVIKVIQDSCKYQQFLNMGHNHWHDNSEYGAGALNVQNDPAIGVITDIDATHVTITSKVYREFNGPNSIPFEQPLPSSPVPDFEDMVRYFPNGKELVRTFDIANNTDVLENGQTHPLSSLKIGDRVLFMSAARPQDAPRDKYGLPATIVHFVKTDIDADYVQPLLVGNPSIINAVARLGGCQGNGDYLCVDSMKEGLPGQVIYASSTMEIPTKEMQRFTDNKKYFRTDIDMQARDTGQYFHHIEGRITKITGAKLELRSRGKIDTFTITLPYDAIKAFNQGKNPRQQTRPGDYIKVDYLQKPNEGRTAIKPGDITGLTLVLRQMNDGSLVKY